VRLLAREIGTRDHAHASFLVEPQRDRLVCAVARDIEPDTEATVGALVAVAVAEDLVGEIELDLVEPAVLLDVRLVIVAGDANLLQRYRHLWCCDVAQLVKRREKAFVTGNE